jgi:hypothetical protein
MKFRTVFAVALLGLSALACGGGGGGSTDLSAYSVPLSDPWTGMSLPVDSGSVLYSDSTTVTITYSGGSVSDLAGKYESAIKGGGWSETFKNTDNGMVTVTYSKDSSTLTLAVMEAAGTTTVSLTKI